MAVFIVTENDRDGFNYGPAEKFGKLRYVFDSDFRNSGRRSIVDVLAHAKKVFEEAFSAEPEEHYLVMNPGPLMNNPIAASVFAYQNGGYLSMLVYHPATNEYQAVHLMTEDDEDEKVKGVA